MKKNVVLIVVDQLRYDTIGANGNEIISTPNLDNLVNNGKNYINAYSATPTCIPARATLLTGLSQKNTGKVGYKDRIKFNYENTIATEFSKRGYYCKCVGKMHVHPPRKLCGFHHIDLHDGYLHTNRTKDVKYNQSYENSDDYLMFLKEKMGVSADLIDLGIDCNSWVSRPFPYEEYLHTTNWVVTKSIEFLKRRDDTMPFFLKMSFTRPHSPYDPPKYYYEMYENENIEKLGVGKWTADKEFSKKEYSTIAKSGIIKDKELIKMIKSYYGLVTHIDHQIGRFLIALEEQRILNETLILFTSDHGDQLGEHNLFRKGYPYQGSVHIPFIIYDPSTREKKVISEIVELRDVLPTLIEMGTNEKIEEFDGRSVLDGEKIRDYLHGEHEMGEFSSQFIITKEYKYIWFPKTNEEQLFNLKNDPNELIDIISENKKIRDELRQILINELKDREEGFVKDNELQKTLNLKSYLSFLEGEIDD